MSPKHVPSLDGAELSQEFFLPAVAYCYITGTNLPVLCIIVIITWRYINNNNNIERDCPWCVQGSQYLCSSAGAGCALVDGIEGLKQKSGGVGKISAVENWGAEDNKQDPKRGKDGAWEGEDGAGLGGNTREDLNPSPCALPIDGALQFISPPCAG